MHNGIPMKTKNSKPIKNCCQPDENLACIGCGEQLRYIATMRREDPTFCGISRYKTNTKQKERNKCQQVKS